MIRLYILCMLFSTLTSTIHAQKKVEKEYRLKPVNVPQRALDDIKKFDFKHKVKWYKERDLTSTTIEAKITSNYGNLSIEFEEDGTFIDLELTMKKKDIPAKIAFKITSYFDANYKRWAIRKIQQQYRDDIDILVSLVKYSENSSSVLPRYEIVAKGKENDKMQLFEFLFSEDGHFLNRREIIFKSIDNLQF